MLFRTIYARQCPVPARDLRSQLKHGRKCLYMNKIDILFFFFFSFLRKDDIDILNNY